MNFFLKNINNDSEEEDSGANSETDDEDQENELPSVNTRVQNLRPREIKNPKKPSKSTPNENDKNSTLNRTLLPEYDGVVYTLDAKLIGNIGRYFNHSCSPNIAVQNVFVDV